MRKLACVLLPLSLGVLPTFASAESVRQRPYVIVFEPGIGDGFCLLTHDQITADKEVISVSEQPAGGRLIDWTSAVNVPSPFGYACRSHGTGKVTEEDAATMASWRR